MYKKILVALDGSSLAEKGLESALATAKQNPGSKLVSLSIIQGAALGEGLTYGGFAYAQLQTQVNQALEENTRKYMDNLLTKFNGQGIDMQVEIGWGDAADGIVNYTEKNKVDLIVITTHGRSGLGKFFLGSVASKVISLSPVPVLVIPPDKKNSTNTKIALAPGSKTK
jgi:nucleotide-binding universal stress UspA family protein